MQRVGRFEKVSFRQYMESMADLSRDNPMSEEEARQIWENIQLPTRATAGSAGYDFRMPYAVALAPGESRKIPTGIRVKIDEGWWLGCFPRSGLGFKYRLQLDNTVGVIDSDYYDSSNEGHIFAKITNDSRDGKSLVLKPQDAFMQGIFLSYGVTYTDDAKGVRDGGMGSTGQ